MALLNYHSKVGDDSDLIRFTFASIHRILGKKLAKIHELILEKSKMSEQGWFGSRYSTLNESNCFKALDSTTTVTKDIPSCILGKKLGKIHELILEKSKMAECTALGSRWSIFPLFPL